MLGALVIYAATLLQRQSVQIEGWIKSQDATWATIQDMQRIRPAIHNGAKILFLNEPVEGWDMLFIAQVVLRDRAALITLQHKEGHILTPSEIAEYNHVLRVDGPRVTLVR